MQRFLIILTSVLALGSAALAADDYTIDPAHSAVNFSVRHMMVSNVRGSFSNVTGSIVYDEKDPSKSSVKAVIKTASIDTGNDSRDKDLRGPSFFDAEKFPEASFESRRVEKREDRWVAIGTLTIKGIAREVELPFDIAKVKTPQGERIGATAELKLNRQDFGISYNRTLDSGGLVVANEVKLELSVEAVPAK